MEIYDHDYDGPHAKTGKRHLGKTRWTREEVLKNIFHSKNFFFTETLLLVKISIYSEHVLELFVIVIRNYTTKDPLSFVDLHPLFFYLDICLVLKKLI